jgi:acyl carrier protein
MLSERELFEQVVAILEPSVKDGVVITEDTDLVDDLALDSLEVMEILLDIEDHFDIFVPINILPSVRTVRDVILQIRKLLAEAE